MTSYGYKQISDEDAKALHAKMKSVRDSVSFRRLQAVHLRGRGMGAEEVSAITGYSQGHVRRIWTRYFSQGLESLIQQGRGGRRRFLLEKEEEEDLLRAHARRAGEGMVLKIEPLHRALCEKVGKEVAPSTAYRLAKRHGWRKLAPRAHHPDHDPQAAQDFKAFFPSPD